MKGLLGTLKNISYLNFSESAKSQIDLYTSPKAVCRCQLCWVSHLKGVHCPLRIPWRVSCSIIFSSLPPHGLYVARQAPLSVAFSRQEYWSDLPFFSPGDLPTQGSKPSLLHCRWILSWLSHPEAPGASAIWKLLSKPGFWAEWVFC